MCGICGFYSRRKITKDKLTVMNDSMAHRGPDDSGTEIFEGFDGYLIGLAQRRLSVIDLSETGHQPMTSADGRITIVFNGEIYNYKELRKELKDYPFLSASDTEVIIASYLKWGIRSVEHFNGMFAIAIYDRRNNELILVRDRIGKKPLYYWIDGANIVFASELKPIMLCSGFAKELNRAVLSRYLLQNYISAPDSIFKDVYKVKPGEIIRFYKGTIKQHKFWDVAAVHQEMRNMPVSDYSQAKEELNEILIASVRRRLYSDVPLGSFLSGGIDSSLVTAVAQRLLGKEPLRTYSIGFDEEDYNEAEFAKMIAEYLGTKHTELYCTEKDMLAMVESMPVYFDEPFADSSQIPMMLVSQLAKRDVTVVLSGDGGDELFCGYRQYDYVEQARRAEWPGYILHIIGKLGNIEDKYPIKIKAVTKNRNPETKTQFTANAYLEYVTGMVDCKESISPQYEFESRYKENDWQERRMLLDMDTSLPGEMLTKVDRAAMKYSLECRSPLLDKDLVEYSFRINHDLKWRNGEKKLILKDLAFDYIPRNLLDREKRGFSIPLSQWLHGALRERIEAYAEIDYLKKQGVFKPDYTHQFVKNFIAKGDSGRGTGKNYSSICWNFFVFQQWYENYYNA